MRDSIQNHQDGAQPDWRALVQQAQERINVLGAALDDMRSVVRDLSFLAQHLPADPTLIAPLSPVAQVVDASPVVQEIKRTAPPLDHDSLSSSSWPSRLETHTPEPEGPPALRRHEELIEKPEAPAIKFGSMLRDDGWAAPGPKIEEEKEADPIADERDAVRRAVEAARAELEVAHAEAELTETEPATDDTLMASAEEAGAEVDPQEQAREEVRRAVERARSEWDLDDPPEPVTWAIGQTEASEGETDARDEVRRAVEQARAELEQDRAAAPGSLWPAGQSSWANNSGWPGSASNAAEAEHESKQAETDEDRDAVRRAVEEARAEMEAGLLSQTDDADAEDESGPSYQERDEIRRTVALARAELELSAMNADEDAPRPDLMAAMAAPRRASWESPTIDEAALMPPVMIIEDAERHVELSRVYEVLNRLECTQQASLLNYAPHNVSIGLTSREFIPQPDAIKAAVKAVFGRGCSVALEGSRLSISIGDDQGKAA